MPIVEFVGMPCSGKTFAYNFFKKKIKKNKLEIYSYSELFYMHSDKIISLNSIERNILSIGLKLYNRRLNLNKKENLNKKYQFKNNDIIKNLKKITKKYISYKLEKVKNKIIINLPSKEKKLFKLLKDSVNKSPIQNDKKTELLSRAKEEIIGIFIYKKLNFKKKILFNDEGLMQRILSGLNNNAKKNFKVINKKIKSLNNYVNIDLILFVDRPIKILKQRSKARKNGFKYDLMKNNDMQNWYKVFGSFYKKYKRRIYKVNSTNNLKILNLIIKRQWK